METTTVDSPQATVTVPLDEWNAMVRKVDSIHAAFLALAKSFGAMQNNPMVRSMSRQFGLDLDSVAASMPEE